MEKEEEEGNKEEKEEILYKKEMDKVSEEVGKKEALQ